MLKFKNDKTGGTLDHITLSQLYTVFRKKVIYIYIFFPYISQFFLANIMKLLNSDINVLKPVSA